jgi:uncharacterized protein YecT (DUF1311 family)
LPENHHCFKTIQSIGEPRGSAAPQCRDGIIAAADIKFWPAIRSARQQFHFATAFEKLPWLVSWLDFPYPLEFGMRAIVLAVVAIQIGLTQPVRAANPADSDRSITDILPLFVINHCEGTKDPADQLSCGDPELNAAGSRLTSAIAERLNRLPNRSLAIEENAEWIRDRNSSCGIFGRQGIGRQDIKSVRDCLLKETEERIEILTDPNFDCLATNTTAGLLICSDPSLALAKTELNELVLGLIGKLKENEAREAFAEYERWTRERDRKCGLEDKDNVPLRELASSEGCLADYFTQKIAEVAAAKGDPKKVFGRQRISPLPNADAVDLCVAQIHSANACGDFLAVNRIFQIDSEVADKNAEVIAEVEMVVLSPFTACSPIASNCTGSCWDLRSGKPKSTPGSREEFLVGYRLRIEKTFAFQKADGNGWRCNSPSLQPVEVGVTLSGP